MAAAWDETKTARMIELWERGLSASQIATELACGSRNTVIGKIHRLRLAGHKFNRIEIKKDPQARKRIGATNGAKGRAKQRRPRQNNLLAANMAHKAQSQRKKLPPVTPHVIDASFAKPWLERRFGECAYPIAGEGADVVSCCAPTQGKTYCPGHAARMFRVNDDIARAQREKARTPSRSDLVFWRVA